MSYYDKYMKYKNKYLYEKMKGGNDYTIIYYNEEFIENVINPINNLQRRYRL